MPTSYEMCDVRRSLLALFVALVTLWAGSGVAAAATTSTTAASTTTVPAPPTTPPTMPTSTTLPPGIPSFGLPTDEGLKLVEEQSAAALDILHSAEARPTVLAALGEARRQYRKVHAHLRALRAQAARTQHDLEVTRQTLREMAVAAYIHADGGQLAAALSSFESASSAVEMGSQLHMIGSYSQTERDAVTRFVALKRQLDGQLRDIANTVRATDANVERAQHALDAVDTTVTLAKQHLAEAADGIAKFHAAATSALSPILGPSLLTAQQMADYVIANGYSPDVTVPLIDLAQMYLDEGTKVGVRGDVAFAQSILETAGFAHPGTKATENNFAGIGWCDTCAHGFDFADARTGVRAQVQLLRIYVDPTVTLTTFTDPIVLPGTLGLGFRGKVHSWWDLWGTWATGALYGQRVYDIYEKMVAYAPHDPATPLPGATAPPQHPEPALPAPPPAAH